MEKVDIKFFSIDLSIQENYLSIFDLFVIR